MMKDILTCLCFRIISSKCLSRPGPTKKERPQVRAITLGPSSSSSYPSPLRRTATLKLTDSLATQSGHRPSGLPLFRRPWPLDHTLTPAPARSVAMLGAEVECPRGRDLDRFMPRRN